jgi:hypothetical protein
LQVRLLASHDHIHVVAAAQAMVGHGKKRIGVRRQIDPHHFRLLVHDVIDKSGVLMA